MVHFFHPGMRQQKRVRCFIAKAAWDSTAVRLLVYARDETEAKEKAWKRVARVMGGDSCLSVKIVGEETYGIRFAT